MKIVLIVEDEVATQALLRGIVSHMGLVPVVCSNGMRGWHFILDNPMISGIIADYKMPEMDGKELVDMIRRESRFDKIPIIMCSAFISIKGISGLLERGVNAFIPKPVRMEDLGEKITQLFLSRPNVKIGSPG